MKYNGAEIVIKLLENEGVKYISGIPGGFILPIYDALYDSKITHILTRHEQGAAFVAQGISRSTDTVGVCFATSGPGATNLLTGIADAKLDSVPNKTDYIRHFTISVGHPEYRLGNSITFCIKSSLCPPFLCRLISPIKEVFKIPECNKQ